MGLSRLSRGFLLSFSGSCRYPDSVVRTCILGPFCYRFPRLPPVSSSLILGRRGMFFLSIFPRLSVLSWTVVGDPIRLSGLADLFVSLARFLSVPPAAPGLVVLVFLYSSFQLAGEGGEGHLLFPIGSKCTRLVNISLLDLTC